MILAVSAITGVVLALRRHWRQLIFLAFALTLEFSLFILTTIIIGRHRPMVPQLDGAPPTSSFPSGHTASALTLYVGLAVVLSTLVRSTLQRTLVWLVAVLLPVVVGVSRLYRGMHFPTDVAASVLLATGACVTDPRRGSVTRATVASVAALHLEAPQAEASLARVLLAASCCRLGQGCKR